MRPGDANIFKSLRLRDRWADVDETWHVYGSRDKTSRKRTFELRPMRARGTDDPPRPGCLLIIILTGSRLCRYDVSFRLNSCVSVMTVLYNIITNGTRQAEEILSQRLITNLYFTIQW